MNGQTLSLRRRVYNRGMRALVWLCAGLTCALLVFLIGYIFCRGIPGLTWELLSGQTSYIKNIPQWWATRECTAQSEKTQCRHSISPRIFSSLLAAN